MVDHDSNIPKNAKSLKYEARHRFKHLPAHLVQLENTQRRFFAAEDMRGVEERNCPETSYFSAITYQMKPVFVPYVEAAREYSHQLEEARRLGGVEDNYLNQLIQGDFYTRPIRGVSLKDIESLPFSSEDPNLLSTESMRAINSFFGTNYLAEAATRLGIPTKNKDSIIRQVALILPVQVAARASEVRTPPNLKPLVSRLTSWLDYYVPYVAGNPEWEAEWEFISNCLWMGKFFWCTLASYMPAKLGITPSSAANLFKERTVSSEYRRSWKPIFNVLKKEYEYAFPKNGVPEEVSPFIRYDHSIGEQVASFIRGQLALPGSSSLENIDEVNAHREILRNEALSSKRKVVKLPFEDHPFLERVLMSAYTETAAASYKGTVMFVLQLKNGLHITIEFNGDKRVYGIPPEVLRDQPHIEDHLIDVAVMPFIDKLRNRATVLSVPQIRSVESAIPYRPVLNVEQVNESQKVKIKTRKAAPVLVLSQPEVPQPAQIIDPVFRVNHSRAEVQAKLGKNTKDQERVDRVMQGIHSFEIDQRDCYLLEEARRLGLRVYGLRVGDDRVLIQSVSGNNYNLAAIIHRSKYNNSTLNKLLHSLKS